MFKKILMSLALIALLVPVTMGQSTTPIMTTDDPDGDSCSGLPWPEMRYYMSNGIKETWICEPGDANFTRKPESLGGDGDSYIEFTDGTTPGTPASDGLTRAYITGEEFYLFPFGGAHTLVPDVGSSPTWTGTHDFTSATIDGLTPFVFEGNPAGDDFETSLVIENPTVDRTLFVPDANSATVQTLSCSNQFFNDFNASTGNLTCATPSLATDMGSSLLPHENGGLELDVNAFGGLVGITGGGTIDVDTSSEVANALDDEVGTGFVVFNADPVFTGIVTMPIAADPTTDTDGECSFDTDGWGTGYDALECWNGTASAYSVMTTATDTPTDGQVPKWNTGGTITWEDDTGTASVLTTGADADSSTTASDSGLETIGGDLTMIRGCADNQILKWDETADDWNCEADAGAAGGDSISIDSVAVVDPDFQSGGDIDFVDTSNVVTANINAAAIDGDNVNANIAGRSLTLTAATPDTLDADAELYTEEESWVIYAGVATAGDDLLVHTNSAITLVSLDCVTTGATTPTETVTVVECTSAGGSCVSAGLVASMTTNLTLVTDDTPTDAAIDANDWWGLDMTTLTTEGDILNCTVEFTRND